MKGVNIERRLKTIIREMDAIVKTYTKNSIGMFANEDPDFIKLFEEYKALNTQRKENV